MFSWYIEAWDAASSTLLLLACMWILVGRFNHSIGDGLVLFDIVWHCSKRNMEDPWRNWIRLVFEEFTAKIYILHYSRPIFCVELGLVLLIVFEEFTAKKSWEYTFYTVQDQLFALIWLLILKNVLFLKF
jgi:hypothetical protein